MLIKVVSITTKKYLYGLIMSYKVVDLNQWQHCSYQIMKSTGDCTDLGLIDTRKLLLSMKKGTTFKFLCLQLTCYQKWSKKLHRSFYIIFLCGHQKLYWKRIPLGFPCSQKLRNRDTASDAIIPPVHLKPLCRTSPPLHQKLDN